MVDAYRILLFDIDGTLVSTGGAGAVAWKQAFQELHGIPADINEFTDAGMTDPTSVRRPSSPCSTASQPPTSWPS